VPLQAFPTVTHLIIRAGADNTTLATIGNNLTTLRHLELYNLAVGYSRSGLKGIAHLDTLRSLVLQVCYHDGGESASVPVLVGVAQIIR
jgi:hypothetical protein